MTLDLCHGWMTGIPWSTDFVFVSALLKKAYSNILNIIPSKNENFQIKILIFFYISAQNTDCGYLLELPRWGGSNEYPQSMFLSRNKKNDVYPCKPQFYYIKVGFKGSTLYSRRFRDVIYWSWYNTWTTLDLCHGWMTGILYLDMS